MSDTLHDRLMAAAKAKEEMTRNMSPTALEAADAAYMSMIEAVVPLFVDDDKETVDLEKMGGARVATMFFADMMQILGTATPDEIKEVFEKV